MQNQWLKSCPDNEAFADLRKDQKPELNREWKEKPTQLWGDYGLSDAKKSGMLNRNNENSVYLATGLCSGRRDTNFTNTVLNRI